MDKSTTMKLMVIIIVTLIHVGHGAAELGFAGDLQNRTARQLNCMENHEYPHTGFCCKNCEAGTYVKQKCSGDQEKGICAPCERGTYAEHPTGMDQCLQCSQCHRDQIMVAECTRTSNTKCECKPGTFCLPDEPCEVCKKCSKCKTDEEEAISCTATSNTKCRKKSSPQPTDKPSASNNSVTTAVGISVLILIVIIAVGMFILHKRCRRRTVDPPGDCEKAKLPIDERSRSEEDQENSRNAVLEREEGKRSESHPLLTQVTQETSTKSIPVEDEDRGLGDSLPNTTSSSQTSLSALPPQVYNEESPQPSPSALRQTETVTEPWARDDGPPRRLVPLIGEEESLSKSFDLFDTLDVRYHNKFFRSIGVSDNSIKVAESQHPVDKVYELLRVWMQKEGLRANINTLLQALLDLDQRYSAEHIASKAVERGYYKYE
ncbi:tumor necrosis factor receptor superfamily member 1A-like isoform X1 [Carassius auratus]|uniref:Tumor necrosis factor receptor superfamily member 1A-like isoform X1 n=1 Tax=Carassius auratus TaxID=7957 RepID=A0A6P6IWK1_CARAU|nr:tumor necrosis factor receptor superfamily member 1A-like isoform X1 [Carassius auratus]XP_052444231.1 tumor necrosis factor receptor superfamily member 1A isoform X1 [Carassius gibelio]